MVRKRLRFFLCLCLLTVAASTSLRAQNSRYRFFHYSTNDGLIDNTVRCFLEDRNGFLWIGTNSGLTRFDGYRFTHYFCNPIDSLSLSGNQIVHLFEDNEGLIWISTHDNGLSVFNPKTNRFKQYMHVPGLDGGVPSNNPTAICYDATGNMWIGFFGKGLAKYDPALDRFDLVSFDAHAGAYNFNEVMDSEADAAGNIWISTRVGLVKFNPSTGGYNCIDQREPSGMKLSEKNLFLKLHIGSNGHVYVGSWVNGIYEYSPSENTWQQHLIDVQVRQNSGYANKVNDFIFLEDDKVLFTSYYFGFGIINLTNGAVEYLNLGNQPWSSATNLETGICLYKSRDYVFMGTSTGFSRMTQRPQSIFEFDGSTLKNEFENGVSVISTFIDDDSDSLLYGGTYYRNGLYSFSKITGKLKSLVPLEGHSGFLVVNGSVQSKLSKNLYYLATSSGLAQFNTLNPSKLTRVVLPDKNVTGAYVSAMHYDFDGTLWLATGNGLYGWNEKAGTLVDVTEKFKESSGLTTFHFISLTCHSKNRIWCVTDNRRLYLFDPMLGTCKKYNAGNPSTDIIKQSVEAVIEDKQGRIWMNMNSIGLACLNPSNDSIRYITFSDGLVSSRISSIVVDQDGNLWALSDRGVSILNTENFHIRNFGRRQGMDLTEANIIQVHSDGHIYVGGKDYAWKINPKELLQEKVTGRIFITSIEISSVECYRCGDYNAIDTLRLHYSDESFRLRFTVPDISSEVDYQYYTRIDGLDHDWVFQGREGDVTYTNLNNGVYTVHFRAKNGAGEWSSNERVMVVIIEPPYWKRAIFIVPISLLLLSFLFWLYRLRIGQIRRKAAEQSALTQHLNELENKALRSQMNPHFIFNSLNSINSYIIKNKTDEASSFVSKFARLIRLILDNSMESSVLLEKELMALNLYVEIENKRFDNKFNWTIDIDPNLDDDRLLVPPMVIQPYVENAIWHGLLHKDTPGTLSISISQYQGHLEICITDDGIGRQAAIGLRSKTSLKTKSHGLDVTAKRIKNFNGDTDLGDAVIITDLFAPDGQPSGTRVLIKLALIYTSNKTQA